MSQHAVLILYFQGLATAALASFIAYATSAFISFLHTEPYRVVADDIDIITRQTHGIHDSDDVDLTLVNGEIVTPLEELDVQETIVLKEKSPRPLRTLLTGVPSPSSLLWTTITFSLNLALLLMVADFIYRAPYLLPSHSLSFARVGYVSDTSARILTREPHHSQYPIRLHYRRADARSDDHRQPVDTSWQHARSIPYLDDLTDYTGAFEISRLRSDTRYQYLLSNNHTGYFTTAPRPGHTSPRNDNVFTFLHSSCILPNFPYSPFRDPLSIPGLRHLSNLLPTLGAQFMLFLGDFIYIDVPRRQGSDLEAYRREYRQVYSSPDWPSVSSSSHQGSDLPWIHVYDDHEIQNDWDKNQTGVYPSAADAWHHYNSAVNPPPIRPDSPTYFTFTQGPASFFMIDTRKYRTPFDNTEGWWSGSSTEQPIKSMLGTQQRLDLLTWLSAPEPSGVRWKIVVSSIPFTKNWRFGSEDTWAGYMGERQVILEAMWDVALSGSGIGVIVLSGDRHEFAATSFPPPAHDPSSPQKKHWPVAATVHEFSVSPLSMFYLPIRTYRESDDSDVCIKYLPDGNSKFGALSMKTPEAGDQSVLEYKLYVDGKQAWSYTLTTPPKGMGSAREMDAIWG